MIGILVIIIISWLLLFIVLKENILSLGLKPTAKRLKQFLIGFLLTGILCILIQYLEASLKSSVWILNKNINATAVLNSFWWDFKSVLTEELIFRGALLYIFIQKIGAKKSILISAISFGIYHWFSYGFLGNILAMVLILIATGIMGYAWAWAFSKTKSIILPFGLHLGWNFTQNTIFSKGPLGKSLFILEGGNELTAWYSLINFISGFIIVPILILVYVKYFVKNK